MIEAHSVALKAFFSIAAEWGIGGDDQLVLLGIYKALEILLPMPARAQAWHRRANEAFGGRSALEVMLGDKVDDLYQVRRHLDAWQG